MQGRLLEYPTSGKKSSKAPPGYLGSSSGSSYASSSGYSTGLSYVSSSEYSKRFRYPYSSYTEYLALSSGGKQPYKSQSEEPLISHVKKPQVEPKMPDIRVVMDDPPLQEKG